MAAGRVVEILITGNATGAIRAIGELAGTVDVGANSMGDKLARVGKTAFLGIAVGAGIAGVAAVKLASDFEKSMELIHTQAGATQKEVDSMSKAILDMAGSLGTSPDDLAKALFHIESTGFRGAKALEELTVAAKGAKIGNADLVDVTNALNAVLSSGIKGAQNMEQAMGALNATVGSGDMHMQDLAEALGSGILAVVKGFGLSLTDVGAALATFGDNNIRGADAATMLRMSVMSLAVGTKGGAAALASLGLTSKTLAADMTSGGLNKAMIDLHDHLLKAGYSGENMGKILTDAFGKKAGPGITVLMGQFDRLQSKMREVSGGANNFGEAWHKTTDTFAFKLDSLKASAEALGIKLGNWLIPIIEKVAVAVSNAVTWLEKHKDVATALGVIVGGLLVVSFAAWTAGIIQATAAAFGLELALGPLTLVVLAVMAIVTAAVLLWTHWDQVWNWIKNHPAIAAVVAVLAAPVAAMVLIVGGLKELWSNWDEVWGWIKQTASDAYDTINAVLIQPLIDAFNTVVGAVRDVKQAMDDISGFASNPFGIGGDGTGGMTPEQKKYFKGHRAGGGPVGPGSWIVGEYGRGGEMMHLNPGSSGYVTKASSTEQMSGGVTVIVKGNIYGVDDLARTMAEIFSRNGGPQMASRAIAH